MKKLFRCIFALCLLCAIDVYASPANDSFLDDNLYKISHLNFNISNYNMFRHTIDKVFKDSSSIYKLNIDELSNIIFQYKVAILPLHILLSSAKVRCRHNDYYLPTVFHICFLLFSDIHLDNAYSWQ